MSARKIAAATVLAAAASPALAAVPWCSTHGQAYNDPVRHTAANGKKQTDAEGCQKACQAETFCEFFTFYQNSGGCWLQGAGVAPFTSVNATSGPVRCPGEAKASTSALSAVPAVPAVAAPPVPAVKVPAAPAVTVPPVPAVATPAVPAVAVPPVPAVTVPAAPAVTVPPVPAVATPAAPAVPAVTVPAAPAVTVPPVPAVATPAAPAVAVPPVTEGATAAAAAKVEGATAAAAAKVEAPAAPKVTAPAVTMPSPSTVTPNMSAPAATEADKGSVTCATVGTAFDDKLRDSPSNMLKAGSAAECQALCQKQVYCDHFTWYTNSGGCWLEGNNATSFKSKWAVSGPTNCQGVKPPVAPLVPAAATVPVVAADTTEKKSKGGFPVWGWILIGLGALSLIAGCAFFFMGGRGAAKKKGRTAPVKATADDLEQAAPLIQTQSKPSKAEAPKTSSKPVSLPAPQPVQQAQVTTVSTPMPVAQPMPAAASVSYVASPTAATYVSSYAAAPAQTTSAFNALDANGDGVISRAEYANATAAPAVTYAAPAATYAAAPAATYAAAPAATYAAAPAVTYASAAAPAATYQMVPGGGVDAFSALDANGDGVLTREEMARLAVRFG
eukprot:TRINITY_DN3895_c0_g1_i2.p1 TRINITY_DN3895_c0_g1~~TRINITY_DN3895_c0_g1_i2.p1  ORF type:complete len:614 (+),score=204.52 TRINITY_DN3895_c0_g1_i2:88-1929(+)